MAMDLNYIVALWTPSFPELVVVLILALLLFGKRLPEVARSLGKGIVEFKKGVKGIEDEVEQAEYQSSKRQIYTGDAGGSDKRSGGDSATT
jgi:sec-independent protein translocase protein TatA